jgi:hypothetical protein
MCDHTNAKVIESTGGITEGHFTEHYKCPCGATGTVTGRAEQPASEWNRSGEVFQ